MTAIPAKSLPTVRYLNAFRFLGDFLSRAGYPTITTECGNIISIGLFESPANFLDDSGPMLSAIALTVGPSTLQLFKEVVATVIP